MNSPGLFNTAKKWWLRRLYLFYRDVRLSILQSVYWTSFEARAVTPTITKPKLMDFILNLKSGFKLKGLIQGNVSRKVRLNIFMSSSFKKPTWTCFVKIVFIYQDALELHQKLKTMLNIGKRCSSPPQVIDACIFSFNFPIDFQLSCLALGMWQNVCLLIQSLLFREPLYVRN